MIIRIREFMYALIVILCAESVCAEQILNLPRAVRDSCAIVRGHPVYLGGSSFYNQEEKYEFKRDAVWSIDITDIYRWSLPTGCSLESQLGLPDNDIPRRLIYVVIGARAIREEEVVIFLECGCSGGHIFTMMGWPLYVVEDEGEGVKRKFIKGWSITGFRETKVSLEDFAKAIKREEKRREEPSGSLGPAFSIID